MLSQFGEEAVVRTGRRPMRDRAHKSCPNCLAVYI
jgi:hypothetical protein